jgi:hypothetical protein
VAQFIIFRKKQNNKASYAHCKKNWDLVTALNDETKTKNKLTHWPLFGQKLR